MGEDVILLEMIKEAVRTGRFYFTRHALNKHPGEERFTPEDALYAIDVGEIIEHYRSENRCLIAGSVPGLEHVSEYITNYIHCVCQYDEVNQIVIITMYRPNRNEWENHFRRR